MKTQNYEYMNTNIILDKGRESLVQYKYIAHWPKSWAEVLGRTSGPNFRAYSQTQEREDIFILYIFFMFFHYCWFWDLWFLWNISWWTISGMCVTSFNSIMLDQTFDFSWSRKSCRFYLINCCFAVTYLSVRCRLLLYWQVPLPFSIFVIFLLNWVVFIM